MVISQLFTSIGRLRYEIRNPRSPVLAALANQPFSRQMIQQLLGEGIPASKLLYYSFDDPAFAISKLDVSAVIGYKQCGKLSSLH